MLRLEDGLLELGLVALEEIPLPLEFLRPDIGVDGRLMAPLVDLRDIVEAGRLRVPPWEGAAEGGLNDCLLFGDNRGTAKLDMGGRSVYGGHVM